MNLKYSMINKLCLSIWLVFLFCNVNAQLEVNSIEIIEDNLENFILDELFDCNVSITNVNYIGNSQAIGQFNYVQDDNLCSEYFGLSRGILMTTGSIEHALGPNNDGDAGENWNIEYEDSFLHNYLVDFDIITPSVNLYDPCVLEFDITSSGSTSIDFEVIFGSEEYTEWMSPFYTDAFCFFVSEINGDIDPNFNATPQNIMEIGNVLNDLSPNLICDFENAPISPWTIRPYSDVFQMTGVNECLYVDNLNGNFCDAIGYDGYTVPMVFNLSIMPQATYRVKMVIIDAVSDSWAGLDSGVFIKQRNMSTSIELDFNWSDPLYNSLGATVLFSPSYINESSIYYWDFNNDGITDSNEINPIFIFEESGTYTVALQIENECTGLSNSISSEVVINNLDFVALHEDVNEFISVFPNPASQNIYISTSHIESNALIQIIDLSGRIIYKKKIIDSDLHMINVSDIVSGMYYLNIVNPSNHSTYYESVVIL